MPPILYLIDGHAVVYRVYYALTGAGGIERWQTRAGEPTAGVYGFASVLLRLLEQDKPEYLAVAFDTGKTFRDDIFPEYKATRAKMPDDLRAQMDRIRQLVDAFHFPRLEREGYEADDVLGSMTKMAVAQGFGVKILTGDRDLLQLVGDRVIVNLAGSKLAEAKDYTSERVAEYMGVKPDQIIDYKALVGDSSDNIPGVQGIGDKTATTLLQKYDTLEGIYEHLGELASGVRGKLDKGREMANLSRNLATIRTDLKFTLDLESAWVQVTDLSAVEQIFQLMEFKTLIPRLHSLEGKGEFPITPPTGAQQLSLFGKEMVRVGETPAHEIDALLINDAEMLRMLAEQLNRADGFSLDTETTSTIPLRADLVGISVAVQPGTGYYIPVGHRTGEQQLDKKMVLDTLRPFLADGNKKKTGHNLKFDCLVLEHHGVKTAGLEFDTMVAGWLIDPASHRLGLKDMAGYYLDIGMTHIEELIGKGKAQRSMAEVPVGQVTAYAAADAEVPLRLRPLLAQKMEEQNAGKLFREIEMPLIPVLMLMEQTGIGLDLPFFSSMSVELRQRMGEIEQEIQKDIGYPFNLNSTQQLSKVLFENLKLKPPRTSTTTASGHISTRADILEEMSGQHPVVDWILEYRELSKLKSTYVDALPLQINPETGRVHTSYNQTGSVTGRLASTDPNLQNIPTRTEIGRRVRNGFKAREGRTLLSVDYSQIELRILAHMSQDQAMLVAFHAGQDIHAATAAGVYGVGLDSVSKEQRRHAKAINFGLMYGMSAFGLSRTTDFTLSESEQFVSAYFQRFPSVKRYLNDLRQLASQQGFVETLLGRRRYFPNLRAQTNSNLRNREEREAINAPIQGTAADIMKLAMINLLPVLQKAGLQAQILLQVHDELVIECPDGQVNETAKVVQSVMENALPLSIPLLTEARSGKTWGSMIQL